MSFEKMDVMPIIVTSHKVLKVLYDSKEWTHDNLLEICKGMNMINICLNYLKDSNYVTFTWTFSKNRNGLKIIQENITAKGIRWFENKEGQE